MPEISAVLEKVVKILEKSGVDYGDVRFDSSSITAISKNVAEENFASGSIRGYHIRLLRGSEWRAISLSDVEAREVLSSAKKLTKFSPTLKEKSSYSKLKPWTFKKEYKCRKDPTGVDSEEKIALVRELYERLKGFDERIVNAGARYADDIVEKYFMNTEGSELYYRAPVIRVVLVSFAKFGKNIQVDHMAHGGFGVGYEFIDRLNVEEDCRSVSKGAVELLNADRAPSGKLPVVLDAEMAGLIAHESFGHGLEADQVLRNRSFLSNMVGKRVASELVTIVDSSSYESAYGSYPFDDEGVRSRKNTIVERGILKGFLHSRETASSFNVAPTGNGRAESFSHKIFVRMSNTYFEKGEWKLEEMLEDIDYGVYLVKGSHGMEDPLGGGLQISSVKGLLIEHGEFTKLLRSISLSGNVLELLRNVDAVGRDFKLDSGTCGKGFEDFVRVTSGGSSLRVKEAIVGGG